MNLINRAMLRVGIFLAKLLIRAYEHDLKHLPNRIQTARIELPGLRRKVEEYEHNLYELRAQHK